MKNKTGERDTQGEGDKEKKGIYDFTFQHKYFSCSNKTDKLTYFIMRIIKRPIYFFQVSDSNKLEQDKGAKNKTGKRDMQGEEDKEKKGIYDFTFQHKYFSCSNKTYKLTYFTMRIINRPKYLFLSSGRAHTRRRSE